MDNVYWEGQSLLGNWYELWKYDMSMNDCYGKLIHDVRVGIELRKIRYVKESEEDVDLWKKMYAYMMERDWEF